MEIREYKNTQPKKALQKSNGIAEILLNNKNIFEIKINQQTKLSLEKIKLTTSDILFTCGLANIINIKNGDILCISINDNYDGSYSIDINSKINKIECKIEIDIKNKRIVNEKIKLGKLAGKGIGLQVIKDQVENGTINGYGLRCTAIRSENMNGYYSFARMGFLMNKKSDKDTLVKMCNKNGDIDIQNTISLGDLMKTEKGRAFWKEHGFSYEAYFDTSVGSESHKILDLYTKEK